MMKNSHLFLLLITSISHFGATPSAYAQTPSIEVKTIGVSYFEAPPGREKNLANFSLSGTLEKVEVHAIATAKNAFFAESPGLLSKDLIKVTAISTANASVSIGTADINNFEKISTDKRKRTLVMSISRLPDQAPKGLIFEGEVPMNTFKNLRQIEQRVDIKAGSKFSLDKSVITFGKVDSKNFSLVGNTDLIRLSTVAIKTADGKINTAKKGGWGRVSSEVTQEWEFVNPISAGTLILEVYEGLQEVKVPVRIAVGRPF